MSNVFGTDKHPTMRIDEALALAFRSPVWDGDHPSKSDRGWFIERGYAKRDNEGMTHLTLKGRLRLQLSPTLHKIRLRQNTHRRATR